METEEVNNISISPLVTIPFAVQWSPDNQISVITEKGVHIFELKPRPMSSSPTFEFARSFVYPSDILPAYTFVNEIESIIWNLEREKVYSLLMEEAITPKLEGVCDTILRIVKIVWSPKNLISPNQCILGILTAAGAVELLHKVSNEWYSICDVSSLRLSIVQDKIKSTLTKCKKGDNQYIMITESMRQLQACSMTWSALIKLANASFAYLSIAYRSGDILIWQIPRISDFTSTLQPILVGTVDLNIAVKITVLCWITIKNTEHLLVIGYFDGRICGVKLKICDNNLQIVSTERYFEPDCMAVSYLNVISQDKSNVKILVAKGYFLLLLCVSRKGILRNIEHMQIEGFSITGITCIDDQQFLITTQDNYVCVIDTQTDHLIKMDIKSHLPQSYVQYLGLTNSPNKIMFINVTSPNTIYDHLVNREPSTMHIFTLKGAKWDPLSIINHSKHLTDIWDCMELLRLKTLKTEDLSMLSRPIPTELKSPSIYNLQISMWMSVITDVCKTKRSISNMDHVREGKISQALPLILIFSACQYLDDLTKKTTLSKDQELSITLLRKYLKVYLENKDNDEVIHRRVQKTLNVTTSYSSLIEKCNLCGETINELLWNITTCPSGHKLPRCNMTLLQITSLDYCVCPICNQIFHLCLKEVYEEPRCLFCDIPILLNVYAFDIQQSKLYGRNISQLGINITESLKQQDMEESLEVDEQQRCKHDIPSTSSVTVHNEDDGFNTITETWEEF